MHDIKKHFSNYEKIKELAGKMAALEGKTYYIYSKGKDEYDFAPFDIESDDRLHAVEFVFPM